MNILTTPGDSTKIIAKNAKQIRVALTWKRPGLLSRIVSGPVDLDLGCFYSLASGKKNLIDCLQFGENGGPSDKPSRQGCLTAEPWIWHTGDSLGEKKDNEEALLINSEGIKDLQRLMIYCYIFDGPALWDAIDAKLIISADNTIEIPITPPGSCRFIALAEIASDLSVTLLGTSHQGHADCDAAYHWNFTYE